MSVHEETPAPAGPRATDRGFLGQPRQLAHLFGVEMWERFSFYGMQAILAYYLYYRVSDGGLGVPQATATSIVGASVVMAGHVALSVLPGLTGVGVGLVLVALGSGGVKATATALVGTLYAEGDARRDAGFSLFYLGINVGALIGPLLTGLAQSAVGFHLGFALAAVGMALGLAQYAWGRRSLRGGEASRVPDPLPAAARLRWALVAVAGVVVVTAAAMLGLLPLAHLAAVVTGTCAVASVAYFAFLLTSSRLDAVERRRVLAFIPMFVASVAFWSLYQQQSTVVALFADTQLDRSLFGATVPASWVQSINPVFIIVLSGAFAALWTRLGRRQPSTPVKFAAGVAVMGVAFLLFLPMSSPEPGSAPLLGLVGVLLAFTVAELLLSPVGLSLSTKLAPRAFPTQMVALWFLSTALGTSLAGVFAGRWSPEGQAGYFGVLGAVAIALAVVLAVVAKPVHRLMSGVD